MSFCCCGPDGGFLGNLERLRKERAAKHRQLLVELEAASAAGDTKKHREIREKINKLFANP